MKIILTNKIATLLSLLSEKKVDEAYDKAQKAKIIEVVQGDTEITVTINDDFIYDMTKAIASVAIPLAGILNSAYSLGYIFGEKVQKVIDKYTEDNTDRAENEVE